MSTASAPLFLLGFHRGGTTFVQRLLNCHPDVTVWGENGGFLTALREAYNGERHPVDPDAYARFSAFADRVVSWASPVDNAGFARAVASFVEGVYRTAPIWGFKEIRHGNLEDIEFIKVLFPDARIVLLRREPRAVLLSTLHAAWSDAPDDGLEAWVSGFVDTVDSTLAAHAAAVNRWPGDAFSLVYEEIHDLPTALAVFDRIGIGSGPVDHGLVETVLGAKVNSSYIDVGRPVADDVRDKVLDLYDRRAVAHR